MKSLPLLAALPALLLTGCGALEIDKPLFSDKDSDVQVFPLFPDNNIDHPLLPDDKVKTEAQAVRIAILHCGNEADDAKHWYAHRDGDVWVVRWNVGENSIYAEINKSDGSFEDCEVDDPAR